MYKYMLMLMAFGSTTNISAGFTCSEFKMNSRCCNTVSGNAACGFDGTIAVGQWMREMCASGDELAALVAHEKAHLVLKHGEKAWYEKFGGWVSSWFVDESKPRGCVDVEGEGADLVLQTRKRT